MSDMNTPIVYHFIALGKPQPLRRARYTRRGKFPHAYDPAENVQAKESLLIQAKVKKQPPDLTAGEFNRSE